MNDHQTVEEIAAHLAPGGPVAQAASWLKHLVEHDDFEAAWRLTSGVLRRRLIEAWVHANWTHPWMQRFDLETITESLIEDRTPSLAWAAFKQTQMGEFHDAYGAEYPHLGVASRPRPLGLDLETVIFTDTRVVPTLVTQPTLVRARSFRMSRTTGEWLVDGLDE